MSDPPPPPGGCGGELLEERDFAGRQIQGRRPCQEDSYGVIPRSEFGGGPQDLFLVVSDGMGGHAAGDLASRVAVQTFAGTFLESRSDSDPGRLWDCLEEANRRIRREQDIRGPSVEGMGATLLAVLLRGRAARWISVGDSPLLLVRNGKAGRLNRIHSMAAELAEKVAAGRITEEQARRDPSRHVLVSALIGECIYEVDDPPPVILERGDILIAATDGLDTLHETEIAGIAASRQKEDAAAIAEALLQAVEMKAKPGQDNTTVVVVKI